MIPGVEAGSSVRLGRCYNVDNRNTGPDIFNPDSVKSQHKNNIYFEYKQVGAASHVTIKDYKVGHCAKRMDISGQWRISCRGGR